MLPSISCIVCYLLSVSLSAPLSSLWSDILQQVFIEDVNCS